LYLAWYHRQLFLFHTIVHEGGTYTFLQTLFYASHFLGHIPMLTVLAFFFTGFMICLAVPRHTGCLHLDKKYIFLILLVFVCGTAVFSIIEFGQSDTWAFISQKKQSVITYEQGGSWNLHLPSTIMQLFLMPVYLYVAKKILRRPIYLNGNGAGHLLLGIFLLVTGTLSFNNDILIALSAVIFDPRYLAHSVRELATFPLIFYPLPLYIILRYSLESQLGNRTEEIWLRPLLAAFAVVFVVGFCYQALVPLREGIGNLAQKPDFARGGKLNVAYLLASHYFEHFLDTVYFCIVCLLMYTGFSCKRNVPYEN
jgi:hypothetical protein